MKRFQFTLDKILKLRAYEERQLELELGRITAKCIALKGDISERDRKKREIFLTRKGKTYDQTFLSVLEEFSERMDYEIRNISGELKMKENEREKVQSTYLEASKKRKVLDKLKERQQKSYYKLQFREELKELDDMNSGRESRNTISVRRETEWQAER